MVHVWQQPTLMETTTLCLRVVPYMQQATRRDRCCSKSRSRCSLIMASTVLMQSCIAHSHSMIQVLPHYGLHSADAVLQCKNTQLDEIAWRAASHRAGEVLLKLQIQEVCRASASLLC